MKITSKGRYGLRILIDLARYNNGAPRQITAISKSQSISPKYVSTLILKLRNAGLVQSIRGINGGYCLKKSPKAVTLLDIVEIMEGPISVIECPKASKRKSNGAPNPLETVYNTINEKIRKNFAAYKLQDLVNLFPAVEEKKKGAAKKSAPKKKDDKKKKSSKKKVSKKK